MALIWVTGFDDYEGTMTENLKTRGGRMIEIYVPPELNELGIGPDLQRFFDAMIYKLRRNASKGRWENFPIEAAFQRLDEERQELDVAIATHSTSEVLMEAADVANFALIIANISLEAKPDA